MRIKVILHSKKDISLPKSYQYALESAVFKTLLNDKEFKRLHDEGTPYGKRTFKGFCFSTIQGKYTTEEKNIIFNGECFFCVSALDERLILAVKAGFEQEGIDLMSNHISDVSVEILDDPDFSDRQEILVRLISPICVKTTSRETGKTRYYNPEESTFFELIKSNFRRKYVAFVGKEPEGTISLSKISGYSYVKRVFLYKGIVYEAWGGRYRLSGDSENLKFLYSLGIGSENSKGCGMFEVIE